MQKFLLTFLGFMIAIVSIGQGQPYTHQNNVYDGDIFSVVFEVKGSPTSLQVLSAGSSPLILKFDDLSNTERNFFYRVIHCDRNWNKSDLRDLDFVDGFNDEPLRRFAYSVNTRTQYLHYDLQLPNTQTKFKASGNYILLIYEESVENPIITRRFIVTEQLAATNMTMIYPTDVENIRYKQELNAEVQMGSLKVRAPQDEFTLAIMQNENWQTEVKSKPNFVLSDKLRFTKAGVYQYWGLTEFRSFDTRSLNVIGRGVEKIKRNTDGYDVKLTDCNSLNETFYTTFFDFNGRYYIDNFDALSVRPQETSEQGRPTFTHHEERDFNADYVTVHFNFKSLVDLYSDEEIYVLGAFNHWQPEEAYRLTWDESSKTYRTSLLLKQGFYNYAFAIANDKGKVTYNKLDGSWGETEHDYHSILYFRGITDLYDRVVSVTTINSNDKSVRY
jgi:Domain of unknown function (DUF5103)